MFVHTLEKVEMGGKSSRLKGSVSPSTSHREFFEPSQPFLIQVRVEYAIDSDHSSMYHIPADAPLSDLTVGWLIDRVTEFMLFRQYTEESDKNLSSAPSVISTCAPGRLVGFRLAQESSHEAKDQWLMDQSRSLWWLSESDVLTAVFAEDAPSDQLGPSSILLADFIPLRIIGEGASCTVLQVRKLDSGQVFALKMMSKERVNQNSKRVERAQTERQVLIRTNHPFIVHLHAAFQSPTHLFLLLEMCPGGELFFHMAKQHKFQEAVAKFYFSETLLGVEYLHSKGVVFRDLKSENVLLDLDGHIRLTDFGLSKEIPAEVTQEHFTSFVGTIGYLPPEMIRRDGHGRALDFYCLGCLLYVMLSGSLPHYSGNWDDMFAKRVRGDRLAYSTNVSEDARDLIDKLLCADPAQRLGCRAKGTMEIKSHPWLKDVDWNLLIQKRVTPPIDPMKTTLNFSAEFTSKSVDEVMSRLKSSAEGPVFPGWNYIEGGSIKCDL